MSDARHQRWLEIIDRETLGEPISAEDQEFRATHEAVNPECARESRAWSEMLAQLSDVGDDDDGDDPEAIVAAALHGGRGPVAPAGRGRVVWLAGLGLAAAAALALAVLPGEDEASPEVAEAPRASSVIETPEAPAPAVEGAPLATLVLAPEGGVSLAGRPAQVGAALREGVALAAENDVCLRFDAPFASVCLAAGSEARLTRDGGDRVVSLTRGAVVAALDSLPEGQGFRVDAPRSSTRAVGTVFAVVVEERGEQVAVLEGVVAVRRGDDEAFVRAGYGLSPESGVPAALAGDALPWIRAHAAMADLWRPGAVARLSVPEEIDATEVVIDGHGVTRGLAVLVSAGAHAIELSSSSGTERRSISVEAGERHELTPVERPRERPKARPVRAKQDSVEALRRRAREARAAGRWHEAATIYRELVDKHPDSPAAGNARVQLGDLLLRRLGAPGEALTHYDAYIARGGDLIVEAHHGRIRALRQLGRTDEEREAIGRFLSQYPGSLAAEQLRARARALDVEPQ